MQGRLPGIQLGRAAAALAVFYQHSHYALTWFDPSRLYTWEWLAHRGAAGVDLFFAISGFIVCHVAARPDFTPVGFLIKRLFRIYPLNAAATLLVVVFWSLSIGGYPQDIDVAQIIRSLLIVPQAARVNSVGWTLEYEVAFYLVASVLIPLGGPRLLFGYCLAAAILGTAIAPQPPIIARFFDDHYGAFGAGVLAYLVLLRLPGLSGTQRWIVAAVVMPAAAGVFLAGLELLQPCLTPLACGLVVIGFALLPYAPRWSVILGDVSYGVYLLHWPLIGLSVRIAIMLKPNPAAGEFWRWEFFAHLCALALLSWIVFEQPINRWASRLVSRRYARRDPSRHLLRVPTARPEGVPRIL